MATQKIVWTVLPKGNHDGTLKISLFMSPRLTPAGASGLLKEFPDFWDPANGHWPGKVGGKPFVLEFKIGPSIVQAKANPVGIKPDAKLWEVLFKASTTVRPFQFSDYSQRFIHSYPVRTVVNYVKGIYRSMAESMPTSFPPLSRGKDDTGLPDLRDLIGTLGPIGGRGTNPTLSSRGGGFNPGARYKDQKRKAIDAGTFSALGFSSQEQLAFTEVQRFYERPHPNNKYREAPSTNMHDIPRRLDTPKPDFHQMLSALGDYPQLMRMLGVVIDFDVDTAGDIGKFLGASAVRVKPQSPSEYSPWTRLMKDFLAEPRPDLGDLDGGLLRLDNQDLYDLVQIDADAVGLKTLQFANNMLGVATGKNVTPRRVSYAVPDEAALPSIRTSGMAIAKYNRAFKMTDRLEKQAQLNTALLSNADSYLYADDLVRGYRVDVLDVKSGAWRSLCQRIGNFFFPGSGHDPLKIAEEGYVKGASTSATKEGTPDDQELYLHENVFQWDGWSLSANRPGKTIVQKTYDAGGNPLPHPTESVEVPKNTAVTEFKMEVDMRPVPGTLPRLRFGREYRMRARAVDLAGNSIPLEFPSSWKEAAPVDIAAPKRDHSSDKLVYGRFEPVSSPALVPLKAFGEGESVENMVIRSNYDVGADAYAGQAYVQAALAGRWYTYAAISERHVAPPKTSQIAAETHGMFDDAIGKGSSHQKAYNISLKEEGTFFDRRIVDIETGEKTITADGVTLVTPPQLAGGKTAVLEGDPVGANQYVLKPGDTVAPGQYVIHDTPKLLLPYLPDPFARGAALRGLPKVASAGSIAGGLEKTKVSAPFAADQYAVKVPFDGAWPDARPFRIRLTEGDGEPEWKGGDERVLVVPLPKGRMANVLYSSYIGKDPGSGRPDYELMGLSRWVSNPASQLAPFAEKGSHWMLTPHRSLQLVHAVQQPLDEPKFTKSQVKKWKIGDTYVDVYGFLDLDVPSTGSIEVIADWFDPLDVLTADKPEDDPSASNRKSNVFKMEIDYDAPDPAPIHVPDVDKQYVPLGSYASYSGVDLPPDAGGGSSSLLPTDSKGVLIGMELEKTMKASAKSSGMGIKTDKMTTGMVKAGGEEKSTKSPLANPAYAPHARHEFNDTKHRFVNYRIVATTRYREYFPPEITRDPKNITRTGPAWEDVNILSSARPDAPKILYVVPTFGWETKKIGDQIVSRRCGGGLRVYLDRPWYSSGIGELLGVVVRSGGGGLKEIKTMVEGAGGKDPLKPLVTDWGMDPLWGSEFPKSQPSTGAFTIATHAQDGLTLDEVPGAEVAVAGHPVDFDETRKLWYCDIEIDMGSSYYPFVRLALARYQPDSIPDAHLSRVVLADFAQIAPDRVAAVIFDPKDEKKVGVVVSGVTGINNLFDAQVTYTPGSKNKPDDVAKAATGHSVMVAVETRLPGSGPDAPWVPLTGGGTPNVTLQPAQQVDDKMIWGGEIILPEPPRQPGGKQYRLVITEIETFRNDTGFPVYLGSQTVRLGTRVVYADTILLQ